METTKYPLYISSKGRYTDKQARTINLLAFYNIDHYLIVEKQERYLYEEACSRLNPTWSLKNILICPGTGVSQSRQVALDHSRQFTNAFWTIDDDIRNIRRSKKVVNPIDMMENFEDLLDNNPKIGLIAPQYTNALWRVEGDLMVNAQTPGLWTLSRNDVPWNYDTDLTIAEDADWAFKFALNGYLAVISNEYSLDTQVIGRSDSKVGGINYDEIELSNSARIMIERYGDLVTPYKDQIRKNWSRLRKRIQ